jgi:hypothetical protein
MSVWKHVDPEDSLIVDCKKKLAENPDDCWTHEKLGRYYYKIFELSQAVTCLKQATQCTQNRICLHRGIGDIQYQLWEQNKDTEQLVGAAEQWAMSLRDPKANNMTDAPYLHRLADSYMILGDYRSVSSTMAAIITQCPEYEKLHQIIHTCAAILYHDNNVADALPYFIHCQEDMVEQEKGWNVVDIMFEIARCQERLGNKHTADMSYTEIYSKLRAQKYSEFKSHLQCRTAPGWTGRFETWIELAGRQVQLLNDFVAADYYSRACEIVADDGRFATAQLNNKCPDMKIIEEDLLPELYINEMECQLRLFNRTTAIGVGEKAFRVGRYNAMLTSFLLGAFAPENPFSDRIEEQEHAAALIESLVRKMLAKARCKWMRIFGVRQTRAAVKIQSRSRLCLVQLHMRQKASAVRVQAVARGRGHRAAVLRHRTQESEAAKLQALCRGHAVRQAETRGRLHAAERIQSLYRGNRDRIVASERKRRILNPAALIQARARGFMRRKELAGLTAASRVLQAHLRGCAHRSFLQRNAKRRAWSRNAVELVQSVSAMPKAHEEDEILKLQQARPGGYAIGVGGRLSRLPIDATTSAGHHSVARAMQNNYRWAPMCVLSDAEVLGLLSAKFLLLQSPVMGMVDGRRLQRLMLEDCVGGAQKIRVETLLLCNCGFGDLGISAVANGLRACSSLRELSVAGSCGGIGVAGATALAGLLRVGSSDDGASEDRIQPRLHRFSLESNLHVGDLGISILANAARGSQYLEKLDFISVGLGDSAMGSVARLLDAPGAALRVLRLRNNHITDAGVQTLVRALATPTCRLQGLWLGGNKLLTDAAAMALAPFLQRKGCPLKELDLSSNQIADDGAECLAAALKGRCSVQRLWLHKTQITARGYSALVAVKAFHEQYALQAKQAPLRLQHLVLDPQSTATARADLLAKKAAEDRLTNWDPNLKAKGQPAYDDDERVHQPNWLLKHKNNAIRK